MSTEPDEAAAAALAQVINCIPGRFKSGDELERHDGHLFWAGCVVCRGDVPAIVRAVLTSQWLRDRDATNRLQGGLLATEAHEAAVGRVEWAVRERSSAAVYEGPDEHAARFNLLSWPEGDAVLVTRRVTAWEPADERAP